MEKQLLNVGCGTHYIDGWVNTDVWQDHSTTPDVLVKMDEPYPFDDDTFDAIYLGHVLEHIAWPRLGVFLTDMVRIAKPGAPVLAVGPDVHKCIKRWANKLEPWDMVVSTMEHQDVDSQIYHMSDDGKYLTKTPPEWWDGAAHHWNCYEERLELVMNTHFDNVKVYSPYIERDLPGNRQDWYDSRTNMRWPTVGYWWWQCAVMGYAPS
jgi:SAM-dependent methyltransferase